MPDDGQRLGQTKYVDSLKQTKDSPMAVDESNPTTSVKRNIKKINK